MFWLHRFVLLDVLFSLIFGSVGDVVKIIIGRGGNKIHQSFKYVDHFSYTNKDVCVKNGQQPFKWCKTKNADPWPSKPLSFSRCSCQCKYNFKTFFDEKEECVNIAYFKNHQHFGTGEYILDVPINLNKNGTMKTKRCKGCQIDSVMYYYNKTWNTISGAKSSWIIQTNGDLKWYSIDSERPKGKILKILLKGCNITNKGQCEWTSGNTIIFTKSNGSYSIPEDLPTIISLSSNLVPTPHLTKSSLMTPSAQATTLTTSKFPLHVSPTSVIVASQHVCSKTICQSSSSDSIPEVLPTTISLSSTLVPTPHLTKSSLMTPSAQATTLTTSKFPLHVSPTSVIVASQHVCSKTICQSSSSVIGPIPGTQNPRSNARLVDEAPSSIGTIVGSVFACIVVIGLIVFIIAWRRCKRSPRPPALSKTSKIPPNSTGNPLYGKNKGEEIALPGRQGKVASRTDEEYDYATLDGGPSDHQKPSTPFYQSLIKENVRDSVYAPLNKEATETPVQYAYNHLQHPQYNPPRSKSDPLYNTLEQPNNDDYMEPETQITDTPTGASEPVYNVLEGPDGSPAPQDHDPVYNVLEDPDANQHPQDHDPVYNVLEDPDANQHPQDHDPVYNVLEDPDANQHPQDNDPIYNVLEDPDDDYDNAPTDDDQNLPSSGQDNAAYSSTIDLKMPQRPSSPDYDVLEGPDGALPDSTYQPLGIKVQDDVYQPLDRRSHSIYQSLEPGDSEA